MKGKSVFYLCLVVAIVSFALGGFFYSWLLAIGIGIGIYIGKILFWVTLIGIGILIFWLMFRKKKTNEDNINNNN